MSKNRSGTKAEQFLRWLQRHPEGKTFSECQRYVVEHIRGKDYDEREPKEVWDSYTGKRIVVGAPGTGPRKWRGVWCDHLLDVYNHPGLFTKFCESRVGKDGKRRYFIARKIRRPFYYWAKHDVEWSEGAKRHFEHEARQKRYQLTGSWE